MEHVTDAGQSVNDNRACWNNLHALVISSWRSWFNPDLSGTFPNVWNVKWASLLLGVSPPAATRGKQTKGQSEATAFPSSGST